jgi:RHS repeat-associated protein
MAADKKISASNISLPKGGGAIKGIGETFQPNPFTGTGNLSIPIYTSPCRDFEPKLSLDYSSGSGNDIFGIGFSLSIPNISRKTEKGLPIYEDLDSDTFILSNAEDLVPKLVENDGKWIKDEMVTTIDDEQYKVRGYRPRTEGLFAKIELWMNLSTGDIHWEVISKENIKSIYGKSKDAKIVEDPDNPSKVFKWLIEETSDAKGNRIEYKYKREDETRVPNDINECDGDYKANKYIKKIKYGNYFDQNDKEKWAFEIVFDYGEHDLNNQVYEQTQPWLKRKDSFSSYRSGFEIRTHRLCRRILMFHHFKELGEKPCLVRSTDFEYDETEIMSFLKAVRQKGYKKNNDGDYEVAEMPPLELKYSTFNPKEQAFKPLSVETGGTVPGLINQSEYLMVDLYGVGIPGVLYSDGLKILYWRGEGKGVFSGPQTVKEFPLERSIAEPQLALMDLGGDGKLDLVVNELPRAGYYQINPDGSCEPFKRFESYPLIDFQNPNKEVVELNEDGLSDILVVEDEYLTYYLSRGKKGYDDPVKLVKEYGEEAFPGNNRAPKEEVLRFADMFGDGLSHRVRIRNGIVECWPNLGYGRFGKRIFFNKAPRFDGKMDPSRLFFADIDGSGTTDLIYAHKDRIDVYFNQSGNSFSDPVTIPLPQGFDNHDQIQIADVLGNGTSCLVLTKNKLGYLGLRHDYYDFTGGVKPHLLIELTNNLGATTRIKYCSSTKFYLEDEKAGKPWISMLPFPVHLIEKTETIDHVSKSKLVTRYKYHHGFYDGEDREFRGFGRVEQWDTEAFEQYSKSGLHDDAPFELNEEGLHVPPVYTKTWYHTGVYERERILSRQYEKEYYKENPERDLDDLLLPDSAFDEKTKKADVESLREAYRALRGKVLRQEIYGEDNKPGLSEHPYTVTESNFKVKMVQPKESQKHTVFFVHPNETITCHYERNPNDPRIEHQFTLEVDEFGNVLKSCSVFYPRRIDPNSYVYPEQAQVKAIANVNRFINKQDDEMNLLGVPSENKSFEIGGLDLGDNTRFTFDEVKRQIDTALIKRNIILFDSELSQNELQSRFLSWQRHYYWNKAQMNKLPLGSVTERALLHHSEETVFSKNQIHKVFERKVTSTILKDEGKFKEPDPDDPEDTEYSLANKYWWNPGLIQHYHKTNDKKFHLPSKTEDPFGKKTTVKYDRYSLLPVEITDPLNNVTKAEINYAVLQPGKIEDPNENTSEVLFDELGMVKVTSIYGDEENNKVGDKPLKDGDVPYQDVKNPNFDDILQNPHKYLQKAASFFYYDLFNWTNTSKPVFSINLLRETHESDLNGNEKSKIQFHITYSDGFGREHQKKVKVESGRAILRDGNGNLIRDDSGNLLEGESENRWLVSGRTIYNNKGKPVKQYEPLYSSTSYYEPEKEVTEWGVTSVIHYDPLLRVIRTDTPKGFFSKVEFSPWMEKSWDENDTVRESRYWNEFPEPLNCVVYEQEVNNEKDALNKACKHYDTPQESILDNLGNAFLVIQRNNHGALLTTRYQFDIQGNQLSITDPRQFELNKTRAANELVRNFVHVFDMTGTKLFIDSVDAGLRLNLNNVLGNPIHSWNSRGFHIKTSYDDLQRPIEIHVKGNELNQIVERMIYGEGQGNDKKKNLRGKLFKHYDQAGIEYFDLYDIKGEVRKSRRQLRKEYKVEVNWNDLNAVELEDGLYETENRYDALGRITSQRNPDQSIYEPEYHPSGLLKEVKVTFNDRTGNTFVENIIYNAKGQREKIVYGNGVTTEYEYERETFRLTHLKTYRGRDNKLLQDIYYAYDPVGNITRIADNSHKNVFYDQSEVEPLCDYTYDALYQLTRATGREHPALSKDSYKKNGFKHSQYLPLKQEVHPNDLQKLQKYTQQYTYDASGNLTRIKHTASSSERSWTRNLTSSQTSNRTVLTEILHNASPDDFFDENGNMIELEHLRDILWNYRDNISSVEIIRREDELSDSEYYVYDSEGNRVRKVFERYTHEGSVTEIEEKIYMGNCEIKRITKKTNADLTTVFERKTLHVMDDTQRIALVHQWVTDDLKRETDNPGERKIHYQLSNHLGSSSLEVNGDAEIISYEEYFPYGGTSLIAGQKEMEVKRKEYRYSGKERDDHTALYYYGARYYAPWTGRWVNPDPAGNVDGSNLYQFVLNNPINSLDSAGSQVDMLEKFHPKGAIPVETELIENIKLTNEVFSKLASKAGELVQDAFESLITSSESMGIELDPITKAKIRTLGILLATATETGLDLTADYLMAAPNLLLLPETVFVGLPEGFKHSISEIRGGLEQGDLDRYFKGVAELSGVIGTVAGLAATGLGGAKAICRKSSYAKMQEAVAIEKEATSALQKSSPQELSDAVERLTKPQSKEFPFLRGPVEKAPGPRTEFALQKFEEFSFEIKTTLSISPLLLRKVTPALFFEEVRKKGQPPPPERKRDDRSKKGRTLR